jgi:hypothetical protein
MIHTAEKKYSQHGRAEVATHPSAIATASWVIFIVVAVLPVSAQDPKLMKFFRDNVALTPDQIKAIRSGQPVAKNLPSRSPAEVFLFGAIYIHSTPESYLKFAQDFDRLRKLPNYLAVGVFSNPPQASDLKDFSFDKDDIKALKNCKPGDCLIQMPSTSIEALHRSIDWSAGDVNEQVNQHLRKTALDRPSSISNKAIKRWGFTTTSTNRQMFLNSSPICLVTARHCQRICQISIDTFSTIPEQDRRMWTTNSTGRG